MTEAEKTRQEWQEYAAGLGDFALKEAYKNAPNEVARAAVLAEMRKRNLEPPSDAAAVPAFPAASAAPQPVVLTAIKVPFWDWVGLMIKLAIAAIPAGIILALIYAVFWGALAAVFGGMFGGGR